MSGVTPRPGLTSDAQADVMAAMINTQADVMAAMINTQAGNR